MLSGLLRHLEREGRSSRYQARQKGLDYGAGIRLHQFIASEPVNCVSGQAQVPIFGHHRGVSLRASHIAISVILLAIYLNDDALTVGDEEKKVQSLPDQRAPIRLFADSIRVVVEVNLRDNRR